MKLVLILVVVDHTLGGYAISTNNLYGMVLILVLVDHTLGVPEIKRDEKLVMS